MSTIHHGSDPSDERHNENPFRVNHFVHDALGDPALCSDSNHNHPSEGAMDRDKDLPYLDPKFNPSKPISVAVSAPTQPAMPPAAAPSPFLIPVPAETMRAAIKEALRQLLAVDVVNDDDDEIVAKLRTVADGLIEAL